MGPAVGRQAPAREADDGASSSNASVFGTDTSFMEPRRKQQGVPLPAPLQAGLSVATAVIAVRVGFRLLRFAGECESILQCMRSR